MKRFLLIFCTLVFAAGFSANAMSPEQVAQKAAAVLNSSKGVDIAFTLVVDGRSAKGTLRGAGNKFSVQLPQGSTWYDGKSLYNYNPKTQETTVTTPTASELLEANPLLYVKGGGAGYAMSFSPVKRTGKYVIDFVPRNKKNGVGKMTVTVNSTTYKVERITVESQGHNTKVEITSFKTDSSIPANAFIYPKGKYPKAEIIDLR